VVCRPTEVVEIALSTGLFVEMRCGFSTLATGQAVCGRAPGGTPSGEPPLQRRG